MIYPWHGRSNAISFGEMEMPDASLAHKLQRTQWRRLLVTGIVTANLEMLFFCPREYHQFQAFYVTVILFPSPLDTTRSLRMRCSPPARLLLLHLLCFDCLL